MASTVTAAKAALLAAIAARPAIAGAGVPVLWSQPTDEAQINRKTEMIYLGGSDQLEEWGALGRARRDEEYDFDVTIRVMQPGNDMRAAEERSRELHEEIRAALAADRTLSSTVKLAALVRAQQEPIAYADGAGSDITLTVRCTAHRV